MPDPLYFTVIHSMNDEGHKTMQQITAETCTCWLTAKSNNYVQNAVAQGNQSKVISWADIAALTEMDLVAITVL